MHYQFDRSRLTVQNGRFILPLQYGIDSCGDQQWMSVQSACLDNISLFVDYGIDIYNAKDVCLTSQCRVFRIHRVDSARRFEI